MENIKIMNADMYWLMCAETSVKFVVVIFSALLGWSLTELIIVGSIPWTAIPQCIHKDSQPMW